MLSRFSRLPLATKVTLLSVTALVLFAAATLFVTMNTLAGDAATRAAERQTQHMNIAWEVLKGYGDEFRIEGDTMTVDGRPLNNFNAPVDKIKELVGGTATVFMRDTRVATNVMKDDGSRAVGTKLAAGPTYDAVLRDGKPFRGEADILGKSYYTAYDPIRDPAGNVIGVLYVGIPSAEITAGISELRTTLGLTTVVVLLIVCGVVFVISRHTFAPLGQMNAAMRRLAEGETDMEIPGRHRTDEVGDMAKALVTFREAAIARAEAETVVRDNQRAAATVIETLNGALDDLSNGVLSNDITAQLPGEYETLRTNFNSALAGLRDLIGAVTESTMTIRTGSQEIADASEDLARRSESNAASLEETTAAVNQINERLRGIAHAARTSAQRAEEATGVVGSGRETAESAVHAMERVSESAKGIDSVIEGLDKIAFQTRVLAMNAAVEAGRAGEAGRGFAVVADLVSALAMRAEEEAKRARDQLTVTRTEVGTAVEAVQNVDEALLRIVNSVSEVNDLLGGMADDNDAQSAAIAQITTAITDMDRSTQQNAAMVEETSAAARNLLTQVDGLAQQANRFSVSGTARATARPARPVAAANALPGATPTPSALPAGAVAALRAPQNGDWAAF